MAMFHSYVAVYQKVNMFHQLCSQPSQHPKGGGISWWSRHGWSQLLHKGSRLDGSKMWERWWIFDDDDDGDDYDDDGDDHYDYDDDYASDYASG